uniref:Uncharacterized protein n=1 Tax=Anguilla anguilla TaxID=7936 RepID=A0A0E9UEW3_ANGAN
MHMLMKFCVDRTYGVGVMAFYTKTLCYSATIWPTHVVFSA